MHSSANGNVIRSIEQSIDQLGYGFALCVAPTKDANSPKEMCYTEGFQDFKAAILALHQTPPVAVPSQMSSGFIGLTAIELARPLTGLSAPKV